MNNKDIANLKLEIHHFFDCEKEDETATREEIMEVIDRLKEIPIQPLSSADVVEVVRCKDCKYRAKGLLLMQICAYFGETDFCSKGERKDTDDSN